MKNLKINNLIKKQLTPFVLAGTIALSTTGCSQKYLLLNTELDKVLVITCDDGNTYLVQEAASYNGLGCKSQHWRDIISGYVIHENIKEAEEPCTYAYSGTLNKTLITKEPISCYLESSDFEFEKEGKIDMGREFIMKLYERIKEKTKNQTEEQENLKIKQKK